MAELLILVVALAGAAGALFLAGRQDVPERMVGVIRRKPWVRQHPDDARLDVKVSGSPGPQARVLRPNSRSWLNPVTTAVSFVPQVFVPSGTIGLVQAKAGQVREPGQRLGKFVPCDYFQDGEAFLRGGGEQGPQLQVLPGGTWYSINPELFDVVTVNSVGIDRLDGVAAESLQEVKILEGNTGVVIVACGAPAPEGDRTVAAPVEGHDHFQRPWEFLARGGRRGVQEQTLGAGGSYAINPWFAQVVLVPSRQIHLNWTKRESKSPFNLDAALDQIEVNVEGHVVSLELSQVLHIPAAAAPALVRRFGQEDPADNESQVVGVRPAPVQRFVRDVLGPVVAGYFTEIVATYRIEQFIEEYDDVRLQLQTRVAQCLDAWGVVAGDTILGEYTCADPGFDELRRQRASERNRREQLEQERRNAKLRYSIERRGIKTEGERQTAELRAMVEMLGPRHVAAERLGAVLKDMSVPQIISGNGDLAGQLLQVMPLQAALNLMRSVTAEHVPGQVSAEPPPVESPTARSLELPVEVAVELPAEEASESATDSGPAVTPAP